MEEAMSSTTPEGLHASAESGDSGITIHKFSIMIKDTPVYYQVTKCGCTLHIWIGDSEGSMHDLAYASGTPSAGTPSATRFLGNAGDTLSTSLAIKLTLKLKKPIYVSYNLKMFNDAGAGLQEVIARLMEEIKICPDKF